jgi:16S rRNA (adenine1518-N6/adenine1519-N6)-dimethyltransferase
MKLSEMRDVLTKEGIQLTKSLGQNFLHDRNQLQRIVDAAELTRQDKVLEIGPGLGPLTDLLLERAGEVFAIEKDRRLVEVLQKRFDPGAVAAEKNRAARATGLRLIHDDALDFLQREPTDWSEWKLVANLPYSVASPILVALAQGERSPKCMVATLQLEVARRLMAQADDDDYGLLTLLVQLDFAPRGWFKIPAACFFPEPDVDSACVCLVRRPSQLLEPGQRPIFMKVVKRAFSQRRKMMLKLLKQDWPAEKLERAYAAAQLSPQIRAEAIGLDSFIQLTRSLSA